MSDQDKKAGMDDGTETGFTPHAARRNCRRTVRSQRQCRSRVAYPPGVGDGALSAGRRRRHHGADPLCQGRHHPGPAIRHRKSWRGRRHHRRSAGREGRARWLHRPARCHCVFGQCRTLFEPSVRLRQGFRSRRAGVAGAEHPGGDAIITGEDDGRRDRLRQGAAQRHRHGIIGQRHAAASVAGIVPLHDRGQGQPRALSRRRPGRERRHRRPGEILFLQRLGGGRNDPGRPAQGDRAHRQGPAEKPAGYSTGVGHAARLRGL